MKTLKQLKDDFKMFYNQTGSDF